MKELIVIVEPTELIFRDFDGNQNTIFSIDEIDMLCEIAQYQFIQVKQIIELLLNKIYDNYNIIGYEGYNAFIKLKCNELAEIKKTKID